MDIQQLTAFERVVREGSFSRAAWSLNVSQPTISARIQGLENAVGGALFRRGRKVALTERGINFLPYARRLLSTWRDGLEATRFEGGTRGRLSIGALRSLMGSFFGAALAKFHALYPEVEGDIRGGDQWQLMELLADDLIELAIICWPLENPLLADVTPLFTLREPVVLVVRPGHPLSKLETVTRADLLEHAAPFLLLRWWQTTPLELTTLASQAERVMDVPAEAGRIMILGSADLHSAGAGFFPMSVVQTDLERGEMHRIEVVDLPPQYRDLALVHLTRRPQRSKSAQRMIALLLDQHSANPLGTLRINAGNELDTKRSK
jgi:LysR family transcriptional regulator, low CO2-responsive transcriptional regulator